jgi:hypothetical protein
MWILVQSVQGPWYDIHAKERGHEIQLANCPDLISTTPFHVTMCRVVKLLRLATLHDILDAGTMS